MQRTCQNPWCGQKFTVSEDDLSFLEKLSPKIGDTVISLPPPTLCVDCRQQRRASYVNHISLYKRTCSFSGEPIVAIFPPESPYKVYKQDIWFGDSWDPLQYGRDFDFNRPFFPQFKELMDVCPWPALFTAYNLDENCEYTNNAGKNKNCYMIFDSDENRYCYYSYSINGSINISGCYRVRKSELCIGCIDCLNCYASAYLQDSENCSDSMFLKNCVGCRHCLMSSNLRNKEYMIENKQATREEFDRIRDLMTSASRLSSAQARFQKLKLEYPQKYVHGVQNENVVGDYVTQSKDSYYCFDCSELWDCRYCFQAFMPLKTCMDTQECGEGERLYECSVCGYGANELIGTAYVLSNASSQFYSMHCRSSQNMLGCHGVRNKKYCVFNQQYSKEDYEKLAAKIISHMQKTGEWGEFFPIEMSYASYNETIAHDYYHLSREEALKRGYKWHDEDPKETLKATAELPDEIGEVPDWIKKEILSCRDCGKNYKILPQELKLYRQLNLPLSVDCFFCSLKSVRSLRNPRKMWERKCQKCGKAVQSTYSPERPAVRGSEEPSGSRGEKIYCENCYLKEIY